MFRANALYEGAYLLGTAIARPLIAKRQIEIAKQVGADAVAHGSTGKGNDQVRFELGYYANNPKIKVIAPWRKWEFKSRKDLIDFERWPGDPLAGITFQRYLEQKAYKLGGYDYRAPAQRLEAVSYTHLTLPTKA